MIPSGRIRVFSALCLVAGLGLGSCRSQGRESAFDILGEWPRFATSEDFFLLPARPWQIDEGSERWELVRPSDLLLVVYKSLSGPFELDLRPVESTVDADHGVTFQLDGRTLDLPWSDGAWSFRASARELPPGIHRLSFIPAGGGRQHSAADADPGSPSRPPLGFAAFRYRIGDDEPRLLLPGNASRLFAISDLIESGVTGADWNGTRWSGTLLDGQRRLRLALPRRAGRFVVDALNGGPGPCVFSLEAAQREERFIAESFAGRTLEIELAGDESSLVLDVQAESDQPALYLWGAPHFLPAPTADRPAPPTRTLILITLDTFRRDLAPFEQNLLASAPLVAPPMPSLTAFAEEAIAYPRAYSTAPWTLPAHASLFTGLYPFHHQIGVVQEAAPADAVLLGEYLARAGYYTLGLAGGGFCHSSRGLAQGFHRWENPHLGGSPGPVLNAQAAHWLADAGDRPVFLFINYFDVHYPYRPLGYEVPDEVDERGRRLLAGDSLALGDLLAGRYRPDATARQAIREAYRLQARDLDAALGDLFATLRRVGRWDEALIVVTSDHGELLGKGGLWGHGHRLDPELIDVPLLVKWPRDRPVPAVPMAPVSIVDVFPTLLEAAGVRWRGLGLDGISLSEPAAIESRGSVRAEEHEAPLHPLHAFERLSDHVVAQITLRQRRVRWIEGAACQSLTDGTLRDEPCDARRLEPAAVPVPRGWVGGMTDAERSILRALGYVGTPQAGSP